jgi:hypothetical protein
VKINFEVLTFTHLNVCLISLESAGFEVPAAMAMESMVFWLAMPCSSETAQSFKGIYHLHF